LPGLPGGKRVGCDRAGVALLTYEGFSRENGRIVGTLEARLGGGKRREENRKKPVTWQKKTRKEVGVGGLQKSRGSRKKIERKRSQSGKGKGGKKLCEPQSGRPDIVGGKRKTNL